LLLLLAVWSKEEILSAPVRGMLIKWPVHTKDGKQKVGRQQEFIIIYRKTNSLNNKIGVDTVPIFEYKCGDCGKTFEILELPGSARKEPICPACSSAKLFKLISAPFLPSAVGKPANDDLHAHTPCCGSNSESQGCTPGSCCGNKQN
jgi:putative FmdB family regulatory protein